MTIDNKSIEKLQGKFFIKGKIIAKTGLHIGGSKSTLNIGEIDMNVIKTPDGKPYIPGSSLKGKLRSILAKIEGCQNIETDLTYIKEIFGESGEKAKQKTLAIFRDSIWVEPDNFCTWELEMDYTESKWETAIDRIKGTAKHGSLRQIERVPAGSEFELNIVVDFLSPTEFKNTKIDVQKFKQMQEAISKEVPIEDSSEKFLTYLILLRRGLALIEDDFIGGHGSRGSGKVEIKVDEISYKSVADYLKNEDLEPIRLDWINKLLTNESC
jgi:CRISPR-associated protein Csm3